MVIPLRYGNTNTYFVRGDRGGILVDTDWAGTLPGFYGALKAKHLHIEEISCVMATHYHPDHIGLISQLMQQGVQLLLFDVQRRFVHAPDAIFAREKLLQYTPIPEEQALHLSCTESRAFLQTLGIAGEVLHTPGHSDDSVSLILDAGVAIVGDLDPLPYLPAYPAEDLRHASWQNILAHRPQQILYAHANAQQLCTNRKEGDRA